MMMTGRAAAVVALVALIGVAVAAQPVVLDGPFSDNGRLPAKPMKACVAGVWTRTLTSTPDVNVVTILIQVAGKSVTIVAPGFGGPWMACLKKRFEASTARYDLTVKGLSKFGTVVFSQTVRQMSFTHGHVMDGQSNMMVPVSAAAAFAGDLTLTNYTRILDEWAANEYYHTTFMSTTSVGNAAFSNVPRNTFASVSVNWTRWDAPNFRSLLMNSFGWQAVTSCIENARRMGPTHCVQIAVATTSIKAHMTNETYAQSGMISTKPFTSAASELLQSPGGLANGAKLPLARWQANSWKFAQGEADWATAGEYGTSTNAFWTWLGEVLDRARAMAGYKKGDEDDEGTHTQRMPYLLHSYEGHSTAPASQNPPFNVTALAQIGGVASFLGNAVGHMLAVIKVDLGFFTNRDGGLHHVDTYFAAAIRDADLYQNRVARTSLVVDPPKIKAQGVVTAFNTATGLTTIELSFDTVDNLPVAWTSVPRPAAVQSKVWQYRQFNNPLYSIGVAQAPTVTTSGTTLTLTFTAERPSFGVPTTLVYTILSDFLQSAITNAVSSVPVNPHWPHLSPLPCQSFSVELVQSPTIVITTATAPFASPVAAALPVLADADPAAAAQLLDVDPEWADVLALQALPSNLAA